MNVILESLGDPIWQIGGVYGRLWAGLSVYAACGEWGLEDCADRPLPRWWVPAGYHLHRAI